MAIDLVRMPPEVSKGFVQAMNFGNSIIRLADGKHEEVVRSLEMPELRWQASKGTFSASRLEEFIGFIRARHGGFRPFRFVDMADCSTNTTNQTGAPSAIDQFLGYGDGVKTEFELRRTYRSTDDDLPQRLAVEDRFLPIVDEVDDRLAKCLGLPTGTTFDPLVAIDAVVQTTGYTINLRRRSIIFDTAPAADEAVTWGGYYDWIVRLGEDADANFEAIREAWSAGNVPNIPLVCVPFTRFVPETDDPGGCKALSWASGVPVLNKAEAKVWELTPLADLSCALQEPSDVNYGGEHFVLINRSATYEVDVVDEISGSAIVTLGTAGSADAGAFIFLRGTGSSRAWFSVSFAA